MTAAFNEMNAICRIYLKINAFNSLKHRSGEMFTMQANECISKHQSKFKSANMPSRRHTECTRVWAENVWFNDLANVDCLPRDLALLWIRRLFLNMRLDAVRVKFDSRLASLHSEKWKLYEIEAKLHDFAIFTFLSVHCEQVVCKMQSTKLVWKKCSTSESISYANLS